MKNYLIIIGSNSHKSINAKVAYELQKKTNYDILSLKEYNLPLYSLEIEEKGIPDEIKKLENKLNEYKTIILFTPEHNGYLPSFLKNVFDWLSRDYKYQNGQSLINKNLFIVSVSPGSTGGESVRNIASKLLTYSGAKIIGTYGIGSFSDDKDFSKEIEIIQSLI